MSLITKKTHRAFDQVRLKPNCWAKEASLESRYCTYRTRDIILSRQRTIKALIRLRECAGWSAPLLFTYGINRFSCDVAHTVTSHLHARALMKSAKYPLCDVSRLSYKDPLLLPRGYYKHTGQLLYEVTNHSGETIRHLEITIMSCEVLFADLCIKLAAAVMWRCQARQ